MELLLEAVGTLLPYHLLSYGALLGTELYQSFVNTKICYQVLPMKEFILLQKRLFPIYFGTQVGLTALTAATHPPFSVLSLVQDPWSVAPLTVVGLTGCLNWFVYGPRTTTATLVRRALQESENTEADSDGSNLRQANRNFARNHAMAIHLNAIAIIATVFYGFSLSAMLQAGI
ncbi:putative mitochondrial outer membrane protein [Penicillium digitatum]|uniref:TMEM205-like domain-containing protein n=3 Tax=Penicillium digitatum TaxID=36651 RepID=K9FR43_PEND2|nr:hypothetical protein PDIP_48470 [Penicillium digitatum Pd1]EKV10837.1 hypothetical protein PDIG_53250 [Penicillium digitatum PHI26]EKV13354.1 hypothetical protein PDIP_48470 [Penicillium digitatum Pd1]KAG0155616.1 hypothetical protein PDIDSM_2789 [Penicillium digitatum]QQK43582.1 putative mitochondrial outer membrane protein [Penicillium digitatum]